MRRHQSLRQLHDVLVEVARVRVQGRGLAGDGGHDSRVGVSNHRHVVVGIEVAPAVGRLHPRAITAHEVERMPIGQRLEGAPQHATPAGQELVVGGVSTERSAGDGRHPPRHLVEADRVHLLEQLPRRGCPAADVLVVRVLRHAPGGDQDRLRHPPGEQVSEQFRLRGLDGQDRCIARQERIGHREEVRAVADERLERGRHVEDQRGVRHVAEVDDAADTLIVVEEQVVEGHVVVDELRAKGRQRRDHAPVEALQDAGQELAPLGRLRHRNAACKLGEVPLVPPDRSAGGGVEEPSQRQTDAADHFPDVRDGRGIQLRRRGGAPRQERQQADEVGGAVHHGGGDGRPVERRPRHRDGQGGIDRPDPLNRGHLHLDHGAVLGGVRDLQHPGGARRIGQAEVLVSLADERLGGGVQAIPLARDFLGVATAERRGRGIKDIGGGHSH